MLQCPRCGARYPASEPRWRCDCGSYLLLEGTDLFSRESLAARPSGIWRYREALGFGGESQIVTLGEGSTPLIEASWNGVEAALKLDYLCPTGSYKDRGSSVMISKLKEWGVSKIIEDSSGNAGASIAAYAALAGIEAEIYIPESTSAGKGAQIAMYGARLVKVPGSREDAARAAWNAAQTTFYASHNWNPYFLAGMKSAAYEIAEQFSWKAPDWVVTPAGGGSLLAGLHLGFTELRSAGWIDSVPRLAAVQSASCDPIYRAWSAGFDEIAPAPKRPTAAEGVSVAQPLRGREILEAIRSSSGIVRTVTDDAVWDALESLGRQGIYVEPTAAAAPAAFEALRSDGIIGAGDRTVIMLTGHGLKATDKILEHFEERRAAALSHRYS